MRQATHQGLAKLWSKNLKREILIRLAMLLLIWPCYLHAEERGIDPGQSRITIYVGKTGLFAAAGHGHEVSAPIAEGIIDDSEAGHVRLRIEAAKLTVLPEKDQEAVQHTMQSSVLESEQFPDISFESTSIRKIGDGNWTVIGNLKLHGETRSITVDVHRSSGAYLGESRIRQTQFGIHPVSAAGGAVKVRDELKVNFVIVPK